MVVCARWGVRVLVARFVGRVFRRAGSLVVVWLVCWAVRARSWVLVPSASRGLPACARLGVLSGRGEMVQEGSVFGALNANGRAQVADIQRARILSAMFDVASERGAASVTVAHVVERSGVSRRTFYETFTSRDDCSLAAFEEAVSYAGERVLPAYRSEDRWRDRVRAALVAFLSFLDDEPLVGRLLVCESFAGASGMSARRNELVARVTAVIEQGRGEEPRLVLPPLTGEGVVGGVLSVLHSRLSEEDRGLLVGLANQLMSMIVLPYLGSAAARRELERPVVVADAALPSTRLLSDPFKDAGMRLTYRTVRVLMAIGEHPQASNRVIGQTAGIEDQGQISKLLARLERIGLISNTGLGPGQGAPNAWTLTQTGSGVVSSIQAHTEHRMESRQR